MAEVSQAAQVASKWRKKRGSLIMALHEIQGVKGYIDWQDAMDVSREMNIPLARIYEVLTFYNFFKLEAPGKAVISVCTGTACYLKGNDKVLEKFKSELGINEGESTADKMFHGSSPFVQTGDLPRRGGNNILYYIAAGLKCK